MKMMGILIMGLLKGTYVNIPFVLRKDYYYSQQNNNIYFIYYFLCHCIDYSEDGKVVGVLIANKTDLDDRRRRVSPKVGHELATQLGLVYFECSAKDFQGMFFSLLMNDIQKIVNTRGKINTNVIHRNHLFLGVENPFYYLANEWHKTRTSQLTEITRR